VDNATAHISPAIGVLATDDDDIGWQTQIAQRAMEANRLLSLVGDLWLNDKEVDIAVKSCLPTGVGAEQDHLGIRSGRSQAAPGLGNHGFVYHRHRPKS